ncbi:Methyltransferase domain-containing protein [Hathewaya proteolytica DSM 3090]|uniref:Methyltransferase domain-containing protein n=1 Tax=Hathewaya proteolytica DSM 3090 TaxID=1121331 RepID=A0A1M6MI78_9CLOT|nr:class I SAM-dependent methyltransferase [Hathewaya proteolytica]SHJ83116.1 Methyltransferase domain-containing protein [Hathewaya proteolytica DSM 3090]
MEAKLRFNEDEKNYDRWRPHYVTDLFKDIISFSNMGPNSNALEIGIGTGQATQPFLETGCHVTAIELGDKLASYTEKKFFQYKNFSIENMSFEKYSGSESSVDIIYSATAFHWIPEKIGYEKVYRLLKKGGTVALFWNHPFVAMKEEKLFDAIQSVYDKYRPSSRKPISINIEDCTTIPKELKKYGFKDISTKLYHGIRTFDAESYICLLNTYSDHRAIKEEKKILFEGELKDTINNYGGYINVYDTIDLYLAKK